MNKREKLRLEFAKKKYDVIPTDEMRELVSQYESLINEPTTVWSDDETLNIKKLRKLNLSDRRLLIVYSIFRCSLRQTAKYFNVDCRTISNNIQRIRALL